MNFTDARNAGTRAEVAVQDVLNRYTKHVYKNVRIDTLFTKTGNTEIDIIAALADIILILEVKNVSKIEGGYYDSYWYLTGLESGERYSTLNVLTQNRIHARSFKNYWYATRREILPVVSVVVVPNGCVVPEDIADGGVLTLEQFERQVSKLCANTYENKYGYHLDYLFGNAGLSLIRSDFAEATNG